MDNSCAESTFVTVKCFISGVVVMKGVLKVLVDIIMGCGEKRRSDWSSTERCAESECAESEPPPYTTYCYNRFFSLKHQL